MINFLKIYIEENNLKWRVDITSWFILTIDESSWCHVLNVMWFFRYIGFSFTVALNYLFLLNLIISLMNWFFLFSRSASSITIYNKPQRYFLYLYFYWNYVYVISFWFQKFFFLNNPEEIPGTSRFYHPSFWKINPSSLNPFFVLWCLRINL